MNRFLSIILSVFILFVSICIASGQIGGGGISGGSGGSGMTYPGTGIPLSTGEAWGTSITSSGEYYGLFSNSDNSGYAFLSPAQIRTALSLQPLDATLTALAGLTIADKSIIQGTGVDGFSVLTCSAANQLLGINAANDAFECKDTINIAGLVLPSSADPDLTSEGGLSYDTDGANVTNDEIIRTFDGTYQWPVARRLHDIHVTVVKPQDLADAVRDAFLFWSNESGMTFTITRIKCWAGTDDTTLNVEETDADGQNNATVDAIECATNGTGVFTDDQTTITGGTIEAGHLLFIDFDDTDDPSYVKLTVTGWFNADVD